MDRVRKQIGLDGQETILINPAIGVGLLDSGVYRHPDLEGSIMLQEDFVNQKKGVYDDFGHGTHVAGILAGTGLLQRGRYKGVAPFVKLYVGKVLNENGQGELHILLKGMEWLYQNRKAFGLKVVNISVGIIGVRELEEKRPGADRKIQKLYELCKAFYEEEILIVSAAGNAGPERNSISALGDCRYVLAVGCHDGSFQIANKRMCAEYSGRGPGRTYFRKPDLVAPGTAIMSCSNLGRGYVKKSGTSMSVPMVSGAAVLAYSKFPEIGIRELIQKLLYTAIDLGEDWSKQGWGMLNVKGLLT